MASYDGSLEAVDCHTHSVRYDMKEVAVTIGICENLRLWLSIYLSTARLHGDATRFLRTKIGST
jgi:hypothetical protein